MKRILTFMLLMMALPGFFPCHAAEASDTVRLRYVAVPDTLVPALQQVLRGNADIVPIDYKSDYTVVGGDTVREILKDRKLGRYDRGLYNYIFIPRGNWQIGITASYGEFSSRDLQMLDMLSDFDFSGHTFSVKPYICYFVKDNQSVGVRLGYTESKGTLGSMSVDFDDDMNFDIKDVLYKNSSYTAAVMYRSYIGLSRRGRFGVFNEIELSFSSGESDFNRHIGGEPRRTHTTYTEARLSFSPGVCVYIMKNVSFNISFGVVGFYLRNEKQWINDEPNGNRFGTGANFRFNLFNINLGLGIHI